MYEMDIEQFMAKRDNNDGMDKPEDFVELVANLHYVIATSPNQDIAIAWGEIYPKSQGLFKSAIALAYPELDKHEVYDLWVDTGESVRDCARMARIAKDI